ncbi:MAG: glycoside hydrolase family 55 protein [Acetatifactor sp.]|nr:glycoside hydrolase family 55 protein [Acetatifactor sp.]
MNRKVMVGLMMCAMLGMLSSCGKVEYTDENVSKMEVTLGTSEDLEVRMTEEGQELSWSSVENAEGYVIYRGSSRLSDDFEMVATVENGVTTYLLNGENNGKYDYYKVRAVSGKTVGELSEAVSFEQTLFGENARIYAPTDDPEVVNNELMKLFNRQETAQFDDKRYAVMFKPGEYAETIDLKTGFYMDVFGLGLLPTDTVLQSFNNPAQWLGDNNNHNATCNFWRGVSNFTVNDNVMWAVSQATFMRRMQINGSLSLHDQNGWASGGFLSDSVITGFTDSGSQQQWLSRNCDWSKWTGQNWNIVFAGIPEGKTPNTTWPVSTYTTVEDVNVMAEKPYIYLDNGEYKVMVPDVVKDSVGPTWTDGVSGTSILLDDFYIAYPDIDSAATINEALSDGKNILFTPGIYELDEAIHVEKEGTVVLGIGLATLRPMAGNVCMEVADADGIRIAGLLFDAWTEKSETLLRVGAEKNSTAHSENPMILSDLFFRVGGVTNENTAVDSCVVINSNDVVGDNFWVWRADHGNGVAWNANTAPNGIIINGDRASFYALMVEHFQEYQTVWNGEEGLTVFYQSELPYDVPNQKAWQSHDGKMNGFASYYVSDEVETHTAIGIGIYAYNRDAKVQELCAMEVPKVEGMDLRNVCAVMITGNPGITHVIDNFGGSCYTAGTRTVVLDFKEELRKEAEKKDKE